jgi:hypothetical protein
VRGAERDERSGNRGYQKGFAPVDRNLLFGLQVGPVLRPMPGPP